MDGGQSVLGPDVELGSPWAVGTPHRIWLPKTSSVNRTVL